MLPDEPDPGSPDPDERRHSGLPGESSRFGGAGLGQFQTDPQAGDGGDRASSSLDGTSF